MPSASLWQTEGCRDFTCTVLQWNTNKIQSTKFYTSHHNSHMSVVLFIIYFLGSWSDLYCNYICKLTWCQDDSCCLGPCTALFHICSWPGFLRKQPIIPWSPCAWCKLPAAMRLTVGTILFPAATGCSVLLWSQKTRSFRKITSTPFLLENKLLFKMTQLWLWHRPSTNWKA